MSVAHQTRRSPNRTFNSEAIQRSGGESTIIPPESGGFTNKQKKIIAGIALSSLLTGGAIVGKIFGKAESVPVHPNAAVTDTVNPGETQKAPAIPNEAKQFVNEVGSRYADPVSTYYAVEAYKNEHASKSPVLSDEFINNYDNSGPRDADLSTLGFTAYRLPLDIDVNQKTLVDIFNNFTKPNLDLYINLLSKNPSAKAIAIIDEELKTYCSGNTPYKEDDGQIEMLMTTVKHEVETHGSTANYSLASAVVEGYSSTKKATLFPMSDGTMSGGITWGKQIIRNYSTGGVALLISTDDYNNKKVTHNDKKVNGVQLNVWRQPITGSLSDAKYTYISIGQS